MRTMWDDGVGKVAAGITSVEELARVCPSERLDRAPGVDSLRARDVAAEVGERA